MGYGRLLRIVLLAMLGIASVAHGAAQGPATSAAAPTAPVLVFAAASLTDSLDAVVRAFTASTQVPVKTAYASSALLARQIEAGAPAAVFISADRESLDYLATRALLEPGSERLLLLNRLVLIAPADSAVRLQIGTGFPLAASLRSGPLALGDPDSVPAGRYARAALEQLGVWASVESRLVRAENVRAALAYVARAEAPLGIVYRTDALAEKRVRIVDTFPASTHPPIVYPVALTRHPDPRAERFLAFLTADPALRIFERYGFSRHPSGDLPAPEAREHASHPGT